MADPDDYPRKQSKGLTAIKVESAIPKRRQELLKWNGWGYQDSKFLVHENSSHEKMIRFTGKRYPIGELDLPYLTEWALRKFDMDMSNDPKNASMPPESSYPKSTISQEVKNEIDSLKIAHSIENMDRVVHSHGQTLHDVDMIRCHKFNRIPDIVVWPSCHEEVVKIVELAEKWNLVIIPFGGGTSVSGAVECPQEEKRAIISLDTTQMNSILWIDYENLVVCCESGILGQDLERELKKLGYTVGHEPDSYEFSSLGGWVATRASGMKKNTYGNIEDLLVHVRMVTPKGVLEKNCRVPRMSCGPDFEQVILGSEGSLGVVTEVMIKIRPVPKHTRYGSIVFPDFESGVHCLREVARQRLQPSSIRLMDNEQFQFGQALRPTASYLGSFVEGLKHIYISKIKGFDFDQICVTTLLFEGNEDDVIAHEKKINAIAIQYGGIPAGARNGERGYLLTFVIAYIRDLAYDYNIIAESFETSVPWDRAISLCKNVKHCLKKECDAHNIKYQLISCRVTQTYDAGCCIYFYFGFKGDGIRDALKVYEHIEEKARDEIIASGGSISHHHGIGKLRRKWYRDTVSDVGVDIYKATKKELDPNNVFANSNLIENPKCKL